MLENTARPAALLAACVVLLLGGCASPSTPGKAQAATDASEATLERFLKDPDMSWLRQHLPNARAVLISPRILQAGFIVGGSGGNAVLHARTAGSPGWTGPAFYKMGTGSVGLQIGAEAAEMVALVMTEKALNSFLSSDFKLGGDVSVAAGPVGAGTGAPITADMVVYVRAKGLYAGLNLSGSVISIDDKANAAFYGREVTPVEILIKHSAVNAAGTAQAHEMARAIAAAGR
ncbi:MAG: lipid-binding SYLF domain-containing protein [Ramlibacter sp.]